MGDSGLLLLNVDLNSPSSSPSVCKFEFNPTGSLFSLSRCSAALIERDLFAELPIFFFIFLFYPLLSSLALFSYHHKIHLLSLLL